MLRRSRRKHLECGGREGEQRFRDFDIRKGTDIRAAGEISILLPLPKLGGGFAGLPVSLLPGMAYPEN